MEWILYHPPRLLQHTLGTGYLAGAARVHLRGHGKGLETGLHNNVMVIGSMELADVEGEATVIDHGYKTFPHQLGVVAANAVGAQLQVKLRMGTTGAVQSYLYQGFSNGARKCPKRVIPRRFPRACPRLCPCPHGLSTSDSGCFWSPRLASSSVSSCLSGLSRTTSPYAGINSARKHKLLSEPERHGRGDAPASHGPHKTPHSRSELWSGRSVVWFFSVVSIRSRRATQCHRIP